MNEQMKELRERVEATMNDEKENLEAYEASMTDSPDMHNCQGWVEALAYVLKVIDRGEEE